MVMPFFTYTSFSLLCSAVNVASLLPNPTTAAQRHQQTGFRTLKRNKRGREEEGTRVEEIKLYRHEEKKRRMLLAEPEASKVCRL